MFPRMSMSLALILCVVAAVLAGVIGVLLGGRGGAALKVERDANLERFLKATKDLEAQSIEIGQLRDERDAARLQLAGHESAQAARDEAHTSQLAELRANRESLEAQFRALSAQMLEAAQAQFLERAEARFRQSEATSGDALKALLAPVESTLKRYEEGLKSVEKDRVGAYGELKTVIEQLTHGNDLVRKETSRLANVMRSSPKARGRWGEEQLKNILEAAGLAENIDFKLQTTVTDQGRQLRPDCIINLPGERCIVVDVKCPLTAFEQAYDEEDEVRRNDLLAAHARAMQAYASDLGKKGYYAQFDRSPEFVIMYIPGEHFLSAASEKAPELIESAFRNGVVIASTINMLALAKVMAGMWREAKLEQDAKEIAKLGKDLFARLSILSSHVARLGKNMGLAVGAYNDFIASLESNVYTQARRFETLNVETAGRKIEVAPLIEPSIRPLVKLAAPSLDGVASD